MKKNKCQKLIILCQIFQPENKFVFPFLVNIKCQRLNKKKDKLMKQFLSPRTMDTAKWDHFRKGPNRSN
jgi:hypothetical protein